VGYTLASAKLRAGFEQNARRLIACAKQLGRTLPLLGEFQPLMRQFFVAPLAFFLPATARELSAFCRVRTQSFRPRVRRLTFQAIAGGEEIHCHRDLHHFPSCMQASALLAFAL
jgi:hypothetical protein